jgi:D-alanyl-D-alanine carboxypeptidase (penicillin-binding protein 5/6)
MTNTSFKNATGLDEAGHYSTARDIAVMSRALLGHEEVLKYTTIWMDSLRNGTFTLANTNRLIRFYDGATGLKTGSTSIAKYCLSGSAKRDGMHLIAVVLGADTGDRRFAEAQKLLNYGFATTRITRCRDGKTSARSRCCREWRTR